MDELKIFTVTFNDGGWHSGGLPNVMVVAKNKEDAKIVAKTIKDGMYNSLYGDWDCWANEFKIDGYRITVEKCNQGE